MHRLKIIAITSHGSRWHCANREITAIRALAIIAVALNFREARLHNALATADCSRTNSPRTVVFHTTSRCVNKRRTRVENTTSVVLGRLSRFRSACYCHREKSRAASLAYSFVKRAIKAGIILSGVFINY